jgi:hypothetical protein
VLIHLSKRRYDSQPSKRNPGEISFGLTGIHTL